MAEGAEQRFCCSGYGKGGSPTCGLASWKCTLWHTVLGHWLLLSPHKGDASCLQGAWCPGRPLGRSRRPRPVGRTGVRLAAPRCAPGPRPGVPSGFSSWKGLCDPVTHFQWAKPPRGSEGVASALPAPAHSLGSPAFPIGVRPGSLPGDPRVQGSTATMPTPCQICVGVTVTQ